MKISLDITDNDTFALANAYEQGAARMARSYAPSNIKTQCIRGSEFGACVRKIYYRLNSTTDTHKDRPYAFLNDGHVNQSTIFRTLREAGYLITEEVALSGNIAGLPILAHADGILQLEDRSLLLECKSVKQPTWRKVLKGEISDEWYGQIQCYLHLAELEEAILIVKNRETSNCLFIKVMADQEYLFSRRDSLSRMINSSVSPDRPYKKKGDECITCQYERKCWDDGVK